jgi:hypothetical protein
MPLDPAPDFRGQVPLSGVNGQLDATGSEPGAFLDEGGGRRKTSVTPGPAVALMQVEGKSHDAQLTGDWHRFRDSLA